MIGRRHGALALLLAAAAGCAHAPPPRAALPAVRWPALPAAARVELVAVLPDAGAIAPRPSVWRRVLDVVTGVDHASDPERSLERPFGVTLVGDGIVVADPDTASVTRFDARGRPARLTCDDRPWDAPMSAAAAADGTLYVADAGRAEIVRVGMDGKCAGLGTGAFERPTGVALSHDRLLVVDPPRHAVVVLSRGGEVLARWGTEGEGDGRLRFPSGIATAPDGTALVVDTLNFRIARFGPDGTWAGAFGERGDGGGAFARPKAVAVDEGGRIYVSDALRDLVLVHRPDGAFEYAVGVTGSAPGAFALPAGVAAGGGRLWVADSHNRRVQVFRLLGGAQ